jgi:hypothetical protein
MTNKIYKSAQGKMIDLGTIMLQNEHVRAVGNMGVNARGDKLDSRNQVIDTRTERIQRHNERTSTNVSSAPPQTSAKKAKEPNARNKKKTVEPEIKIHSKGHTESAPVTSDHPTPAPAQAPSRPPVETRQVVAPAPVATPAPVVPTVQAPARAPEVDLNNPARPAKSPVAGTAAQAPPGGLAGAIARSREIKQELDRSRRQQAQDQGLRKI